MARLSASRSRASSPAWARLVCGPHCRSFALIVVFIVQLGEICSTAQSTLGITRQIFVEFEAESEAQQAAAALSGRKFAERTVCIALEKIQHYACCPHKQTLSRTKCTVGHYLFITECYLCGRMAPRARAARAHSPIRWLHRFSLRKATQTTTLTSNRGPAPNPCTPRLPRFGALHEWRVADSLLLVE